MPTREAYARDGCNPSIIAVILYVFIMKYIHRIAIATEMILHKISVMNSLYDMPG